MTTALSTTSSPSTAGASASDQRDLVLHWYLPTYGDSRGVMSGGHGSGLSHGERPATLDYMAQLCQAAEANGFESVLIPTGQWCQEGWVVASAMAARTSRVKFLVAVRPGLVAAPLLAQQVQTLQDLSGGRVAVNVVIGGEDLEQRTFGDFTTKQQRYERADEVLAAAQHLWSSDEPLTVSGDYVQVEGAQLAQRPAVQPPIFFGGSSPIGIEVAGRRADVYLTWGETPDKVAAKLDRVRHAAAEAGREDIDFGIRLHVIARPTEEEAWGEAQRLLDGIDPAKVARVQARLATSQSEGQRLQSELHGRGAGFHTGTPARDLEVAPNLWAGIGLVRGGAGTSLIGSYEQVAQRLAEYRAIGIRHVILSGYPHLEETWHVGEGLVPQLQRAGIDVRHHTTR
ncbi:LLM class flavin-dependent oxidoreductase [Corynebacterium heidelbergense]|uniref:Alkanesulfonate monooxygenase n=1 Tax=Corynebacterium heidelbergense TaxID=2055947 RepID=A0A364VD24_9CORY|nr:alkanesulfonate monooxygenase [Corynebacterium heidelbergense]WCZ35592.1 Alkanesulfonate monooxygenase [Corynebacterium heidelbergense]